jgi:hypothetical protein
VSGLPAERFSSKKNSKLFQAGQLCLWQRVTFCSPMQATLVLPASLHDGGAAMKATLSALVALIALSVLAGVASPASALDANGLGGKTSLEQQDRLAY